MNILVITMKIPSSFLLQLFTLQYLHTSIISIVIDHFFTKKRLSQWISSAFTNLFMFVLHQFFLFISDQRSISILESPSFYQAEDQAFLPLHHLPTRSCTNWVPSFWKARTLFEFFLCFDYLSATCLPHKSLPSQSIPCSIKIGHWETVPIARLQMSVPTERQQRFKQGCLKGNMRVSVTLCPTGYAL